MQKITKISCIDFLQNLENLIFGPFLPPKYQENHKNFTSRIFIKLEKPHFGSLIPRTRIFSKNPAVT